MLFRWVNEDPVSQFARLNLIFKIEYIQVIILRKKRGGGEILLTLFQTTHFYSSRFKALADDNFKFDENGRKFSKQVENTVGKGEIARYEQGLFGKRLNIDISTAIYSQVTIVLQPLL